MKTLKWVYKVLRGIIFTAIILMAVVFIALYTALSIPPVQGFIRDRIETELSQFLGSKVMIRNLTIHPLNEVIIEDVHFYDLNNTECLSVERLGAGINLWRLLINREIEVTYVELIDFKANIYQEKKDEPLNIDFIIKAFQPKDKNKPPTPFDLKIHNIVLREGEAKFARLWMPENKLTKFDINHVAVSGLKADITIPRLSNDDTQIDLRHFSLSEKSGLQIRELSGFFKLTPDDLAINNFYLKLPSSEIKIEDFILPFHFLKNFETTSDKIEVDVHNSRINPSDLAAFYPPLSGLDKPIPIDISISGNRNMMFVNKLEIGKEKGFNISAKGYASNIFETGKMEIDLENLDIDLNSAHFHDLISLIPLDISNKEIIKSLYNLGFLDLALKGRYNGRLNEFTTNVELTSEIADISLEGNIVLAKNCIQAVADIEIPKLSLSNLLSNTPVNYLNDTKIRVAGSFNISDIKKSEGNVELSVGEINLLGRTLNSINCNASYTSNACSGSLNIDDSNLKGEVQASLILDGAETKWDLEANIKDFDTYNSFILEDPAKGYEMAGIISAHGTGNSPENCAGNIELSELKVAKLNGQEYNLKHLSLDFENHQNALNHINLKSDYVDFAMEGHYDIIKLPGMIKRTMGEIIPSVFNSYNGSAECGEGSFELSVKDVDPLVELFRIPVVPLTALSINGSFDSNSDRIEFSSKIPYIQQGSNTLITDTYIEAYIVGKEGRSEIAAGTVYPTKKGLLKMDLLLESYKGEYAISLDLNRGRDVAFNGNVSIDLFLERDPLSNEIEIRADWQPSHLMLNETEWTIEEAKMVYDREGVRINNFSIRHNDQYIVINGYSKKDGEGEIVLDLADINVDYIFETLNIPHVTFGGNATGKAFARSIFSPNPEIYTQDFVIKDMSYNGAVVGDGEIFGSFNLPELKVGIGAKIQNNRHVVADVDGGVWIGKDSLAFNFDADKINVGIIKPFMQAFSSDIRGTASGKALLCGTFSDIDMTGTLIADNVEMLIDYINVRYLASDTVYMKPGKIELPDFLVKDKFGHTAVINGVVNHRYFHDPTFVFTVSDMDRLLVYDTNAKLNPLWYGTIFASGVGEISGRPGLVSIKADVSTNKGSDFTFVLSDQQEAVKSSFLTFTDKRKKALEEASVQVVQEDTVPDFLKKFQKKQNIVAESYASDVFTMDIRADVTDDVRFNLVMDPIAGDKITAYGNGAMNMTYSTLTDELRLYGKYILEKGTYNFSLQDIILKEFTIKPGSSIAFTGDPYTGTLDLTAAYRVNTSLTELDNSFANDRELNRTSVPVEALLQVTGALTSPSITFDIDLPTVTEETAQKVRSIISTDDMMSRQVLYLVALNKFYPPEYMSNTSTGGEWASIATSTISSQIQNMIGQLTDKFSLAPSIKSDKGDFSDLEFDLGLSSQLFNNRLLINGNLGYRDPSNSSTTFIGDFDLEYLLNKKGTWRLKAYNHFNDQNYYLKSSLTTQGLGIVWRKDFGLPRKPEEATRDTVGRNK